uniref:Uncharacterized protein LOC114337690 n=1 Tax=Diabrotica virgifera virgifera TaxID=50390 RepID=A0A6P7GJP8_DIAVI
MKSTPHAALLAEANLLEPEQRRKLLTIGFLKKIIYIRNHPLTKLVSNTRRILINRPAFWRDDNTPYLIAGFAEFMPYLKDIYKSNNFPCYEVPYNTLCNIVKTVPLSLKKNDPMIKEQFLINKKNIKQLIPLYSLMHRRKILQQGLEPVYQISTLNTAQSYQITSPYVRRRL